MNEVIVVNVNDMEFEEVRRGRVRTIRRKRLPVESGVPSVTLEFSHCLVPDGYFTPRHKHNFDQIRFTLEGVQSTGQGDLGPNEIGYFPEGTPYGPQQQEGDCLALVLQFQGASGEHLLSNEEMNATHGKMLAEGGVFENGVYKGRPSDPHPKNKDAYEAIWEEHEGRELTFPAPRYRDPVMMLADNFSFVPDRKRPGVEVKHLGTFSEMRHGLSFVRLVPGARIAPETLEDAEIRFVLEGSVRYQGREWGSGTYFWIPAGAPLDALESDAGAVFYAINLPIIAEMAARQTARQAEMAAE
jgi:hypothetical protein